MPAVIQSTLYESPGGPVVPGSTQANSRDDLHLGYQVVLQSVQVATTYSWTIAFASDSPGSTVPGTPFDGTQSATALLAPEGSTSQSAKFNVDFEGTYLIRLVVDAGLPSEDTQFIRCRVLTLFGALKLVAAGERRDENGVIPVDATPEGWANDQNANLQRVAILLRRLSTSGRVLYVDANRGRDNTATPNDYDNVIALPGPELARPEETGIKIRAMAHGDFSTINDAIAYASAAAARGEPAPSKANPYYIFIRPGFYAEDLNFTSFVHLVGDVEASDLDVGPESKAITIRTVNAGGVGTHQYNPSALASVAECFLYNLHLENTANTTNPVVSHRGGLLQLVRCVVLQRGNAANQGEALRCVAVNPAFAPAVWAVDSHIETLAATATRVAFRVDAPDSQVYLHRTSIRAASCIAVRVNETLYASSWFGLLDHSSIEGLVPYWGYASAQVFQNSVVQSLDLPATPAINVSGSGPKPGAVDLNLRNTHLTGSVSFATANAVGATSVTYSGVTQTGISGPTGVVFPDAPGDQPDDYTQETRADTLWYVRGYVDPRLGPAGAATINVANQVAIEDVQRIIDILWQGTFPVVGSPFYSLSSGYNGVTALNPFTTGVGLGRNINAVGGAVQIQGATWPQGPESYLRHGGLQVEGVVDIGGFIGAAGLMLDEGGSEIHLNPNLSGSGPFIGLGRAAWANGITQPDRGFAAGSIVAGGFQAPAGTAPFHLHLRTADQVNPSTGKSGNVYMVAGGISYSGNDNAGEVHVVAGSARGAAGLHGNIWLVPGTSTGPAAGAVWFVGKPTGAVRASLTPVNAFVAGTGGTIYFSTPSGIETIVLTGAEANATAAAVAINTQARSLTAANVGGKVVLYSEYGPAGDLLFLTDSNSGALNTALGDYILGDGATFVPGTYGHKVKVDVPQNGRFKVWGDIEYTGALIPAPGGGGLGTYVQTSVVLYNQGAGEGIIGFDTTLNDITFAILAGQAAGTTLILKHESGNNHISVLPPGGETIEGAASWLMGASGTTSDPGYAMVLYKATGTDWKIWSEYRSDPSKLREVGASRTWNDYERCDIYSCQLVATVDIVITLSVSMLSGRTVTIKDEYGLANNIPSPGGQKIRIIESSGKLFDGAAFVDITTAYGSVTLFKNKTTGNWSII